MLLCTLLQHFKVVIIITKYIRSKNLWGIVAIITLTIFGLAYFEAGNMEVEWVTYPDIGTLADKSGYIIIGQVEDKGRGVYSEALNSVITDYRVKVIENIKSKDKEVEYNFVVSQFGGYASGKFVTLKNGPQIPQSKKKYLFFLNPTSDGHNLIYLQGQYLIDENNEIKINGNKEKLNKIVKQINDYFKNKGIETERLLLR